MPFTSETASKAGKKSSRKGVPNKSTAAVREYFQELLTDNLHQFREDIELLDPAQRIKVLLELARYVIPRLNTVHYVDDTPKKSYINLEKLTTEELEFLVGLYDKYELPDEE